MKRQYRPGGITAIALLDYLIGVSLVLISFVDGVQAPLNIPIFLVGAFFLVFGYGAWVGISWAWYLLTFGGGFLGWYFARNEVKDFFGIENGNDAPYSGD